MDGSQFSVTKQQWRTPTDIFMLADTDEGFVWLDSALKSGDDGRFSFIMSHPDEVLTGGGNHFCALRNGLEIDCNKNPFALIASSLKRNKSERESFLFPFRGGYAGYLGYELLRFAEPSTSINHAEPGLEEMWFGLYSDFLVFDNHNKDLWIVGRNRQNIQRLENLLEKKMDQYEPVKDDLLNVKELASDFSPEEYYRAVEEVRSYIEQGDCYQANISRKITAPAPPDSKKLYARLRAINGAPYSAFITTCRKTIFSSSPERFISRRGERLQARPIKGTRRLTGKHAEDELLMSELLESEKERAENIMIVDLLRNDLSKVCEPGSVEVTELCQLEKFPGLCHLTSTVEGLMKKDMDVADLLNAVFPCGSVTGAPKIRAMEIIDEIEKRSRGVYCGAIGYFNMDGDLDLCVAIRVMVRANKKMSFHTGGGVTYGSDPEAEYEETVTKSAMMMRALCGE